MQLFWEMVASNALLVVVLALGVGVLGRFWRNPPGLHLLWMLVLLKLITPPLVTIPVALPATPTSPALQEHAADPSPIELPTRDIAAATVVAEDRRFADDRSVSESPVVGVAAEPLAVHHQAIPWLNVFGGMWIAGIVVFASGHAYRIVRFQRLLQSGESPSVAVGDMAERIAARLGLRQVPAIRMLPVRMSPLVWSLGGRPQVFLPADLFKQLDEAAQEAILAHELAHVRRKDHWIRLLELVITTLFWWHPVAWWAARHLRELEDQCCDAIVVDLAPHDAKSYATALLDTLDFLSERSVAAPLGAAVAKSSLSLARRITMLTNRSWSVRWTFGRLGLLLTLAALPMALAFGQKPPAGAGTDSEKTEKTTTFDVRLLGQWDHVDDGDRNTSYIISSKDDDGTLEAVGVGESSREKKPLVFTTVQVGKQWCMIVNWPTDGHKTELMLLAYTIRDDGVLEVRLAKEDKLAAGVKAGELRGIVVQADRWSWTGWLPELTKGEAATITDSHEAVAEFLTKHGSECFEEDAIPLLKKRPDKASVSRRAVNKLVKDFPEKTDLSTPESAAAAFNRVVSSSDPTAWLELSAWKYSPRDVEEIKQKLAAHKDKVAETNDAYRDAEIIEVLIYRDNVAGVICKLKLPEGARDPYSSRSFGRISGEWKNFGENRLPSLEEARKDFYGKTDRLWEDYVKVLEGIRKGKPVRLEAGDLSSSRPKRSAPIAPGEPLGISVEKADLMGRVEWAMMHGGRDITARKTIEWGEIEKDEDGNRTIRYKYYATIWDKDILIMNQVFTFDAQGNILNMEDVEGFPQKKVVKPADVNTQEGMKELVEDFFSKNFRDITSRETIEWGDVTKTEGGNSSIRYKYRATIWDKDVKIMNQVFTFDPNGKYVSFKNVDGFPQDP